MTAAGLAEACRDIVALALSEAVAAALGALAWREIRIAEAPNAAALVAALNSDVADRARPSSSSAKQEAPA